MFILILPIGYLPMLARPVSNQPRWNQNQQLSERTAKKATNIHTHIYIPRRVELSGPCVRFPDHHFTWNCSCMPRSTRKIILRMNIPRWRTTLRRNIGWLRSAQKSTEHLKTRKLIASWSTYIQYALTKGCNAICMYIYIYIHMKAWLRVAAGLNGAFDWHSARFLNKLLYWPSVNIEGARNIIFNDVQKFCNIHTWTRNPYTWVCQALSWTLASTCDSHSNQSISFS